MNIVTSEPQRDLRLDKVLEVTGLSRSTLYRKVGDGTFPPQVKLSDRCIGWRSSDVQNWTDDPAGFAETKLREQRPALDRSIRRMHGAPPLHRDLASARCGEIWPQDLGPVPQIVEVV